MKDLLNQIDSYIKLGNFEDLFISIKKSIKGESFLWTIIE